MVTHHINQFVKALFVALVFFISPISHQFSEAAPTNFQVQKRYLYIQPGQTIFSIVKVLYPDQQDMWPGIIERIVKRNPHAFEDGHANRIIVGRRIELPSSKSKIKPTPAAVVYKGPEAVGQVILSRGKTFAISADNKNRNIEVGSEVYVGDRLFTGVKGYLRLSMIDDAKIDLRCNSEMLIEDYRLMRAGNRSIIYLLKGSLRKITGQIGKISDDVYEMKTPISTVGVRGTDYALRVLQAHGCDGSLDVNSKGLFVKVNQGAIDLKNKTGSVQLAAGNAAHVTDENKKPQAISVQEGVFEKAPEEEEDEETSWWWWLLGIALIAAAA